MASDEIDVHLDDARQRLEDAKASVQRPETNLAAKYVAAQTQIATVEILLAAVLAVKNINIQPSHHECECSCEMPNFPIPSIFLDNTDVATVLRFVGWDEPDVDTMCAIACAEAPAKLDHHIPTVYADAVGDLELADPIYHGSFGFLQIRAIRSPESQYKSVDRWRVPGPALLNPFYCAWVALQLKNAYGLDIWSKYKDGSYKQHLGMRPALVTGHPQRDAWWR